MQQELPRNTPNRLTSTCAVVVGGGVAGLTAATFLARAGVRVTLLERTKKLGGRAASTTTGGFTLNQGPHALYRGGAAAEVLAELGVSYEAHAPSTDGVLGLFEGGLARLPVGPMSLLLCRGLSFGAKAAVGKMLARVPKLNPRELAKLSVTELLEDATASVQARDFLAAMTRLVTYGGDPDRMSAEVAVLQLKLALEAGVLYLDDGWQSLVRGLELAAERAGVAVVTGDRAVAVEAGASVTGVITDRGERYPAHVVVLATSPRGASDLLGGVAGRALLEYAQAAPPVRAACLDLGLRRLPDPTRNFVLGVDAPLYLSNHSAPARLTRDGGVVVHVAKYLGLSAGDAAADLIELESLLDRVQPGWRREELVRRYLPRITAKCALATAATGGLAGRPGVAVASVRGAYIAGDWVSDEGVLVDASFASGRRAASAALDTLGVCSEAAA